MGIFSKAKEQYQALQAQAAAMSGVDPASDIPPFVAPWPQEEVDRLLQGAGPIRAIVFGKSHQVLLDGERVGRMRVDLRVRPRGPEGSLGDEVKVKASVSSWVATLIERGLDIPVERDPATGAITKVASKQLTEELESRKAEADAIRPAWALDSDVQAAIDLPADIRKALSGKPQPASATPAAPSPLATPTSPPPSADQPRPDPVNGVSWQQYVSVLAYLHAHPEYKDPREADAVAQLYGVTPNTWVAVSGAWEEHIASESALADLLLWDVAVARAAL